MARRETADRETERLAPVHVPIVGDAPMKLGPQSRAGLEQAALQVLHRRHPSLRFEVVRDDENTARTTADDTGA